MFKRRAVRNRIFDNLHKGFVLSCVGLTLLGTYIVGERLYTYYTVMRPVLKAKQLEEKQKLLSEGKATVDGLHDSATTIEA